MDAAYAQTPSLQAPGNMHYLAPTEAEAYDAAVLSLSGKMEQAYLTHQDSSVVLEFKSKQDTTREKNFIDCANLSANFSHFSARAGVAKAVDKHGHEIIHGTPIGVSNYGYAVLRVVQDKQTALLYTANLNVHVCEGNVVFNELDLKIKNCGFLGTHANGVFAYHKESCTIRWATLVPNENDGRIITASKWQELQLPPELRPYTVTQMISDGFSACVVLQDAGVVVLFFDGSAPFVLGPFKCQLSEESLSAARAQHIYTTTHIPCAVAYDDINPFVVVVLTNNGAATVFNVEQHLLPCHIAMSKFIAAEYGTSAASDMIENSTWKFPGIEPPRAIRSRGVTLDQQAVSDGVLVVCMQHSVALSHPAICKKSAVEWAAHTHTRVCFGQVRDTPQPYNDVAACASYVVSHSTNGTISLGSLFADYGQNGNWLAGKELGMGLVVETPYRSIYALMLRFFVLLPDCKLFIGMPCTQADAYTRQALQSQY